MRPPELESPTTALPDAPTDAEHTALVHETRSLGDRALYNSIFWTSFAALTVGYGFRATGREHVPEEGAVLLASNHASNIDPVAIGVASPRYLSCLAKQELFRNRLMGALIGHLGARPVNRKFARAGLQEGRDMLNEGKAVLLFPEGERSKDGKLKPLKPGITTLMKQNVPVVPVGIAGSHAAMGKGRIPSLSPLMFSPNDASLAVAFGEPMTPGDIANMDREEMLADLHRRIAECIAQAEDIRRK